MGNVKIRLTMWADDVWFSLTYAITLSVSPNLSLGSWCQIKYAVLQNPSQTPNSVQVSNTCTDALRRIEALS